MRSKSTDQSDDQIIWFLFFFEKINQLYHVMIVSSYHLNFYHCTASSIYLSTKPFEKAVLIQIIWKSRPHSTHLKKPFPFNFFEKAVLIQPIWKSRPHSIHLKKSFSCNFVETVVRSFSCVDHPAALTTQLRWPPSWVDHPAAEIRLIILHMIANDTRVYWYVKHTIPNEAKKGPKRKCLALTESPCNLHVSLRVMRTHLSQLD
jgi:hypothetical protein